MPTTYAIPDGRTVMAATTYTGAGGTQTITNTVNGVGFQPDFVWGKARSVTYSNALFDSVRGFGSAKGLLSNATQAEGTTSAQYGYVSTNTSTGFTATGGTDVSNPNASLNESGVTYVAWQWKAGGTAVSNTAGTITTTVSANATAGFSVITYSGNATDNATIGHGLSSAPQFLIWKPRNAVSDWMVWHIGLSGYNYDVRLNTTAAQGTGANPLNSTAPGTSVVTLRNQGDVNGSGKNIVCYAFAAVAGYSAFGSYTGNGSTDGPFLYMGFRPRFVMWKRTDSSSSWTIYDTTRSTYNAVGVYLVPDSSGVEGTYNAYDLNSNGIKIRGNDASINASGGTYVYACFGENPFKFANAR